MKTLFDETQTLPEGLWVVKWIDRISLGRGFTGSPRVRVFLLRLPFSDVAELDRLFQEGVAYLIGKPPGPHEPALLEHRDVLAGMLPVLRLGDVLRGRDVVGQLRQRRTIVTISPGTSPSLVSIFRQTLPPEGWGDAPHSVLNRFEYELGPKDNVRGAKCLRVSSSGVDYVIPATVILKTFYGFHTKVANAICSGRWETRFRDVISTLRYESGIGTYVNPSTGAWNIVVQPGLTRAHAVRLALLYFDDYARQCANAIHSSSLEQTHGQRADDERFWFAEAQIPYRWDHEPFRMQVTGYPLRPFRPSAAVTRFLVTQIEATSWPLGDQAIFSELANSNSLGPDRESRPVARPYYGRKPPPVQAREDASISHQSDPYARAPDNWVAGDDFRFLDTPQHYQQTKTSHKSYEGSQTLNPEESAAALLSAGNAAPGSTKPAPLVADLKDRHPVGQLHYLITALADLANEGRISAVEVLGPPENSHLRILRHNVACWSFLTEDETRRLHVDSRGWPYHVDRSGPNLRQASARCLLVIQVLVDGRNLVLFEIEPRALETGYRLYVCEPSGDVDWVSVENVLITLRAYEGRLDEHGLGSAFKSLTPRPAIALNHSYKRDGDDRIVGLNKDALLRGLQRRSSQSLTPGESAGTGAHDEALA